MTRLEDHSQGLGPEDEPSGDDGDAYEPLDLTDETATDLGPDIQVQK